MEQAVWVIALPLSESRLPAPGWSPSRPSSMGFHPDVQMSQACLFVHVWPSLFHSFLNTGHFCRPFCPLLFLLHKANGCGFTSGRCRRAHPGEGRRERKNKTDLRGRKVVKRSETPLYFISSYIIHLELHLGWCKSVPSHPPFWAFTLKRLCGWSVLRRFGPCSLPHPPVLINHYAAEPHLSSWWETSNEHRDHGSTQPQKYFIRSTFKHTSPCGWPH